MGEATGRDGGRLEGHEFGAEGPLRGRRVAAAAGEEQREQGEGRQAAHRAQEARASPM
jgi:hypothetical protein